MIDYTEHGKIVQGHRWPPADCVLTVRIPRADALGGWPDGADGWTWELLLSQGWAGGDPDLAVEADSATLVDADGTDDRIDLTFYLTAEQTADLPVPSGGRLAVDVRSTNGAVTSIYDCVRGHAHIRKASGGAS